MINAWNALTTPLQNRNRTGNRPFEALREQRILEAIQLQAGSSADSPLPHPVDTLPNGADVVLLKPGKKGPYDMVPVVPGYEKANFQATWLPLSRIAWADPDAFTALAVTIYRLAFLLDHVGVQGKLRYRPSGPIRACIAAVDQRVGNLLPGVGVWSLLLFLDVLGWNEDVKYHGKDGVPKFLAPPAFAAGAVNTLLSTIRVPYEVAQLVRDGAAKASTPSRVDFGPLMVLLQDLISKFGVCPADDKQLLHWFSPYIKA